MPSLTTLAWLFTVGVLLHNTEEAIRLPAWSGTAGRWHAPVGAVEFRFAVIVLSLLLVAACAAASTAGPQSVPAYLFTGYAFAMVANAFVPHAAASLALRHWMPGTLSALIFNLPLGSWFLWRAHAEGFVTWQRSLWVAPAAALALVASIPLLFGIGRRLARASAPQH